MFVFKVIIVGSLSIMFGYLITFHSNALLRVFQCLH